MMSLLQITYGGLTLPSNAPKEDAISIYLLLVQDYTPNAQKIATDIHKKTHLQTNIVCQVCMSKTLSYCTHSEKAGESKL